LSIGQVDVERHGERQPVVVVEGVEVAGEQRRDDTG
jgi:hypothetical protein